MKIKVTKLSTFYEKAKGLMFSEGNDAVYLETRFGIHTFFLKSSIDVVILDKEYYVRVIRRNLKPGRVFFWNPKYFRVIEFPSKAKLPKSIAVRKKLFITFSVK